MKRNLQLLALLMAGCGMATLSHAQVNVGVQAATQAATHVAVPATQSVTHEATQAATQAARSTVQAAQSTTTALNGNAATAISASGGVASNGLNTTAQAEAKQSTQVNASSHALLKHERKMARRAAREAHRAARNTEKAASNTQVSASGSAQGETKAHASAIQTQQQGQAKVQATTGHNEVKASGQTTTHGSVHQ